MTETLISRNTIQLGSTASSTDNYYVGYSVEFTRYYKLSGKKTVQTSKIVAYNGANKIATIGDVWMEDVIPGPETTITKDSYRIIPTYSDGRVSINPAIQTLDYVTSDRYGRGLDAHKDLYLPSWLETARYCDAQSDVTVETTGVSTLAVNAVYRYPATGPVLFQGTVTSIDGNFVRFTNVLGKLTNLWNSWKFYPTGAIVYYVNRTYLVSSGGTVSTTPTHTSGTVGNLTFISGTFNLNKVSGTGPSTLALPADGNPIRVKKNGVYFSGYSLYDADGINYWRYLGWDEHSQRNVTQHQTNLVIDTSQSLFDNTNSLLEHFGGMMRYNAGKYYLEIEDAEGDNIASTGDPRNITADDINSKIKISDDGIRSSYNSLTVAFADPANKFEARNISFFNSDYLRQDRNVAKKGNLSIPGITNYYNARLLAERYLVKSRYGLTISFNMTPKGVLLTAGRVIQIPYDRYGWADKKFRISDITHNPDASVDIVADEYSDSFYQIKASTQPPAVGSAAIRSPTTVGSPSNLRATNSTDGSQEISGIELKWDNVPGLDPTNVGTEIYVSSSPHYYLNIINLNADLHTFTTDVNHGLVKGSAITPDISANGLVAGVKYYIQSVPAANQFTLSDYPNGPLLSFIGPGTMSVQVSTVVLLQVVPYPENRYFDAYMAGDGSQISKYYWIRYRIN